MGGTAGTREAGPSLLDPARRAVGPVWDGPLRRLLLRTPVSGNFLQRWLHGPEKLLGRQPLPAGADRGAAVVT